MKYRGITRKLFYCLLAITFFFFFACGEPLNNPPPEQSIPAGKGSVTLIINGINERTILPSGLDQFKAYTITFIDSLTSMVVDTIDCTDVNAPHTIAFTPGTYDIQVTAYADDDRNHAAAQGIGNGIEIVAGENTIHNITLEPLIDSVIQGSFRWEIKFPNDITSASMTITPVDLLNGTPKEEIPFTGTTSPFTGSCDLNAGYYRVIFELRQTDKQDIIFHEFLHVYNYLESFFSYEFTDIDFNNILYTVTFNPNYEGGVSFTDSVIHGNKATQPDDPKKPFLPVAGLYQHPMPEYYELEGWDDSNDLPFNFDNTVITSDITLKARWKSPAIDISTQDDSAIIDNAITYINANPASYTLYLDSINATLNNPALTGNLTLIGLGEVTLNPQSYSVFTIGDGVTLTIGDRITIQGVAGNIGALVTVNSGGIFNMTGGSITGNTIVSSDNNAAVKVNGGTFNMSGGSINSNYNNSTGSPVGSAVYVYAGGTFNMSGDAKINDNTADTPNTGSNPDNKRAAVYITGTGSFNMTEDSKILSNNSPLGDVFIDSAVSLTLSDSASIGTLTLNAASATNNSSAAIGSDWIGSVESLNFRGDSPSIDTVISNWVNKTVLKSPVTAAIVEKFTLGDLITSDGSDNQPIGNDYCINNSGFLVRQYTVTFESNGGSPVSDQTIIQGGKVSEPAAEPTKDGYSFGGWFKEEDFVNLWDFETDTVSDATTLYAKWD